jgi:hypothetical protein
MTLYRALSLAIDSYTESITEFEKDGHRCDAVRGMLDGVTYARDMLTLETAGMESA